MIAGGNHTLIYKDSVPYSVLEESDKLQFNKEKDQPGWVGPHFERYYTRAAVMIAIL